MAPSSAQRLPEDRGSLHLPNERGAGGEVGPEPIFYLFIFFLFKTFITVITKK